MQMRTCFPSSVRGSALTSDASCYDWRSFVGDEGSCSFWRRARSLAVASFNRSIDARAAVPWSAEAHNGLALSPSVQESWVITLPSVRSTSRAVALTFPLAASVASRHAITWANVRPFLSLGNGSPRISVKASVSGVLLGRPAGFGLSSPLRQRVAAPIAGLKSLAIACFSPVFRLMSTPSVGKTSGVWILR
jgi:hypothetical protein